MRLKRFPRKIEKVQFESHLNFVEVRAHWCVCVVALTNKFSEKMKKLLVVGRVYSQIGVRTHNLRSPLESVFSKQI